MSFTRPTLAELVARVRSDFRGRLSISGTLLRRAMADVLGTVWAGAVHMLHGHLEWLAKQLFADTAESEYLLRQAAMYGITPTAATYASGNVTATGSDDSIIPEDTILQLEGVQFRVTAEATIASGIATVAVTAVLAGTSGNVAEGVDLTFESPIAGVDATATVATGGITGGTEEEDIEEVRDRLLLRLREPPAGGAAQDYEAWALAVAGVTRAWVYPHENGLGTVVVRFVRDDESPIFPSAGEVTAMQTALDAERPITAEVTAAAPTAHTVNFTISITPDTSALRTAVSEELADLLARDAEPSDGAGRGTIKLSRIQMTVGLAEGIEDFAITVPAADVTPALGALAVMGTVTWT